LIDDIDLLNTIRGIWEKCPIYGYRRISRLIGLPLSYILAFIFHFGVEGFIFGSMLAMFASSAILMC